MFIYNFNILDLDVSVTIPSKKRVWTSTEINALKEHFGEKFAQRKYPSSKEMNAARKKDSRLASREISVIRSWFSNQYNKKSKKKTVID